MAEQIYDLAIVGAGPAGLAAAIYAGRGGLKALLLDGMGGGGQVNIIDKVENYPGVLDAETGAELADRMRRQAEGFGVPVTYDQIESISDQGEHFLLKGGSESYLARTMIIATGARHRPLGVPGEGRLMGRGVSVCATCDGAFFKGKPVAVVGGGSSAVMESIYLTRIVGSVTLIHRRDKLRAEKLLQDRFFAAPNATTIWDSVVEEIIGEKQVEGVRVRNLKTGEVKVLPVSAVFVFIGLLPNSDFVSNLVERDEAGFIKVNIDMRTSHPRIFAAGDVRADSARQVATAVGDGVTAAVKVQELLDSSTPPRDYQKPGR